MSDTYAYFTRIIPGLSVTGVVALLVFGFVLSSPYGRTDREHYGRATRSQLILSVYTCFLHVLSIMFPARACWAMGDVMRKMKEAAISAEKPRKRKAQIHKHDQGTTTYPPLIFIIILPAYKEDIETLKETLRVLTCHAQARQSYHVRVEPTMAPDVDLTCKHVSSSPVLTCFDC